MDIDLPLNWTNNVELNGILETKPQFYELAPNKEMVKFTITQVTGGISNGKSYRKSFTLTSYSKKVIEELKETKEKCIICCIGMVSFVARKSKFGTQYQDMTIQVTQIRTNGFMREELETYVKKNS